MFQTFEPATDRSYAAKHVPLLREEMQKQGLDGFIVPHADEYQNEYAPARGKRLQWLSGFTGSAGAAIVFADSAVIFVDGRYTLQVRSEVDDTIFTYEDITESPPAKWLEAHGPKDAIIGYDPMLHTKGGVETLRKGGGQSRLYLKARDRKSAGRSLDRPTARPHHKSLCARGALCRAKPFGQAR